MDSYTPTYIKNVVTFLGTQCI